MPRVLLLGVSKERRNVVGQRGETTRLEHDDPLPPYGRPVQAAREFAPIAPSLIEKPLRDQRPPAAHRWTQVDADPRPLEHRRCGETPSG